MDEVAMAVKVVLSLCCVGACSLALYLYHILWLVPQKILAKFEDQKIGGPRPSFPYGNLADMREAAAAAKAARASARRSGAGAGGIVHDYRAAVLPYYEKWRKEYVNDPSAFHVELVPEDGVRPYSPEFESKNDFTDPTDGPSSFPCVGPCCMTVEEDDDDSDNE